MPVHRETLIAHENIRETEERLADVVGDLREEILERDLERALARIEELRRYADELEQTLLRVGR